MSGGDVACEAQDVTDGELGGRDDVGGRRVDDHDPRLGGALDVDIVESDSGARHDLQVLRDCNGFGIHLCGGAD
jgi:hypothetical protein